MSLTVYEHVRQAGGGLAAAMMCALLKECRPGARCRAVMIPVSEPA